ncbi:hypothetical protein [Ramlibacter alkalitolerans]|uniref:Uncharacterized protein n=1 Tax=Ramlibacter alkalitolerans TaxID=2039631 RepID=A0ABS1JJL5_9BURK|nr:hypothetical protein [Ramlibacter alkalitolerans]MBL0424412.1 hypothetical protein [Ramlibacter alkalitolerans]
MRNIMITAAVAVASLIAAAPAASKDPAKGDTVSSAVEIGNVRVALPPGTWNVVGEHTGKAVSSDGIPSGATYKAYYLVQFDQLKRFIGSFHVRATTEAGKPIEWRDKACQREDTLFRAALGGPAHSQNCVIMNHLVRYMQTKPRDHSDREAWQWMQENNVKVPKTVLQVQERFFQPGEYLWVDYTVNPELVDFVPSTVADWRESEWHPSFVQADPERKEYVEHLKAWALANAQVHHAALTGVKTGEIAPYPR